MDETKVQIGEDVLLDIGTHSDWYISAVSYDGESVNVDLRRKAARHKEWWLADTPQTYKDKVVCPNCGRSDYIRSFEKDFNIKNSGYRYKCINCNTYIEDEPQTDCAWK